MWIRFIVHIVSIVAVLTFVVPVTAQQKSLELKPVVVNATRQEEEVLRIPAHITVITLEDIQQSSATNTGELLRAEAGIWITNTSGSSPTGLIIDARGFNNGGGNGSRMLILIDGRRANQVDSSVTDWAAIPLESIERIEIIRGSSTALYGDNAMAGVINIITRKGTVEPSFRGGLEVGSYDTWNRRFSLSGDNDTLSYYLFGNHESTDGFRDNSDYRASNYVGNFGYRTSSYSTLKFRTSYLTNDRELPGALTETELTTEGRDGSVTDDRGKNHQGQWDVGFDSYLSQQQWIELSGGQTLRSGGSTITFPGSGSTDLDSNSRSSALIGKYRLTTPVSGFENRLMIGIDLHKERVAAESFNNFPDPLFPFINTEFTTYERKLLGAYAYDELSLHPSLILTLSGRMDWSKFRFSRKQTDEVTSISTKSSGSRSFQVWSPKAGLTLMTSPTTSVFAVWSRSFRFPNRDELTGLFGLTPELDPEQATTYEFGSQIQIGGIHQASTSVYRMKVKDEILFVPPATGSFINGMNGNIPVVEHEGIEVSIMTRYSESVRLKGSYTVARTKIKDGPFEGNDLPITPKHAGSATIDLGKSEGWMLSLNGRFVAKRYLANDLANDQEKLPDYAVYDARLAYSTTGFETFFGVNNVFDREYEEFGGDGGPPFGNPSGEHRIGVNPSPGRNYMGGATLKF
jgi:iron complex outermembrane recepter protein